MIGAVLASGCDKVKDSATGASEDLCGPCGLVATGDIGISGNAKVDGFFKAVADLNSAALKVQTSFITDLAALEAAFGLESDASLDLETRVDNLVGEIKGQIDANVDGGLAIKYAPPQCSANLSVAVEAQASCEAKADCEVEVDPGNVSVTCEGTCSGSCSGTCSGDFSCKVQAPSVKCEGKCEGSCELEAAAKCEGTCQGECDGTCSVENSDGSCNGECDGECQGTCQLKAAAECSGTCSGSCLTTPGEAGCDAEAQCSGDCEGECSGGCQGEATPPSAKGKCEASAECKGQAKAQASANVECTPPSLELAFDFNADVDAEAQAKFSAQIDALKVHGVAMLQSFARYQALIDGKVNGEVVFKPSPLASLKASISDLADAGVDGELFVGMPKLRIGCAIAAFADAGEILVKIGSKATGNLKAQASFATALTGGFSS